MQWWLEVQEFVRSVVSESEPMEVIRGRLQSMSLLHVGIFGVDTLGMTDK